MPNVLEEELETIKQNEYRVVNFNSGIRNKNKDNGIKSHKVNKEVNNKGNAYREVYTPID